jgi:L-erythro-3,5-diaminohexanoate dehydrogenase
VSGVSVSLADAAALGIWRALEPPGTLLHSAKRVDAETAANEYEAEVEVELLNVDATSFRVLRERCEADPQRIADAIGRIVAERGKLQNPWTGSGGVLMGQLRSVGSQYCLPDLVPGQRVIAQASLIAIPLRLDAVGPVDPGSAQVPVRGRAILTGRMPCVLAPEDIPPSAALAAFDVYPVASNMRDLAGAGEHVLVLGSGHAGLLALAAARRAVGPDGVLTIVDYSAAALERAPTVDPAVQAIRADVTNALAVAEELARLGLPPADLTLQCTSAYGAEATAMVATADHGTILFFSTATSFSDAGLGADAIGSHAKLVIPNGLTDDLGQYAFSLLREIPPLRAAFEETVAG